MPPEEQDIITGNLLLAEDRVLCYAAALKTKERRRTALEPRAVFYFAGEAPLTRKGWVLLFCSKILSIICDYQLRQTLRLLPFREGDGLMAQLLVTSTWDSTTQSLSLIRGSPCFPR